MTDLDLPALARVVDDAADAARDETLPRFRRSQVELKADGTPVTEADLAAERTIRAILRDALPNAAIVGEELEDERTGARLEWLIDPIDGTIAFSRGIPTYSTLIALAVDGTPVLGMIDLPGLGERYSGWRGGGVRCNGHPVRVGEREELDDALIAHGDVFAFDDYGARDAWLRLSTDTRLLRGYTDGFGHAMVLRGAVDAMVDLSLNRWDVAPTEVLIGEAGGVCRRVTKRAGARDYGVIIGNRSMVDGLATRLDLGE